MKLNPFKNGRLHRIHLWTDVGIGSIAISTILLGEELMGSLFYQADFFFHVAIFVLAIGGVLAERIFHGRKHKGVIGS